MDVVHAVDDDAAHLLEALERPHGRDRVALHEDVAVGEELDGLERRAVRADDALAALDKALLVADQARNLDDIARDAVLQDLERLRRGHATREQLEQVTALEHDIRVPRLARRPHSHPALHQVQLARQPVRVQRRRDAAPLGAQVRLAVLGEEERKGRFVEEGLVLPRRRGVEWLDLPAAGVSYRTEQQGTIVLLTGQCRPCPRLQVSLRFHFRQQHSRLSFL
jgi:hypothetical protein